MKSNLSQQAFAINGKFLDSLNTIICFSLILTHFLKLSIITLHYNLSIRHHSTYQLDECVCVASTRCILCFRPAADWFCTISTAFLTGEDIYDLRVRSSADWCSNPRCRSHLRHSVWKVYIFGFSAGTDRYLLHWVSSTMFPAKKQDCKLLWRSCLCVYADIRRIIRCMNEPKLNWSLI